MISSRTSEHILSYTSDEGQTLGGRSNEQHGAALAVIIESPAAMKGALAVLPEDLRAAIRVRAVQCMGHHLRNSGVGLCNRAIGCLLGGEVSFSR
jgi:hypothetical protein